MFVSLVTFLIAVTLLVPFADKLNELALESRFIELLFETNSKILKDIFQAVGKFTESYEIILPAHPRLKNFIDNQKISFKIDRKEPIKNCDFVINL